ncbi:MAG TPA: hypothetical protein VII79_07005 [Candidatus Dormibacteraeota bacterium]
MAATDGGPDQELPEKERSRIRHRDRKRETRMVVDNAGVKRLVPAVAQRRRKRKDEPPATD